MQSSQNRVLKEHKKDLREVHHAACSVEEFANVLSSVVEVLVKSWLPCPPKKKTLCLSISNNNNQPASAPHRTVTFSKQGIATRRKSKKKKNNFFFHHTTINPG
jgi:hypothetical protein